ncbi:hypothetical protein [Gemmata sp.]|uniref:hypothetical protein n=1 Tax=Gemmata sp. TaxID=1914242 RepID=UPI003F6E96D6
MTFDPRISLAAVLAALGVAAAAALATTTPVALPVAPQAWHDDAAERDRSDVLDAKFDAICRRIDAKSRVVDAVRGGRVTWGEGVEQFHGIIAGDPEVLAILRDRFPGRTDAELAEQNLLQHLSVAPAAQ